MSRLLALVLPGLPRQPSQPNPENPSSVSGFISDIAQAITYAADNGARVVNVSLGSTQMSAALQTAVNYALAKNVVIVAAAGNCGAESGTSRCPTLRPSARFRRAEMQALLVLR